MNKFRQIERMKNQLQQTLLQGIKDLHIKILQSNNIIDVGNYLQEILDHVTEIPAAYSEKLRKKYWKDVSQSDIAAMMKADIKSILDGTYSRLEIAKYKATLHIAWIKGFFKENPTH